MQSAEKSPERNAAHSAGTGERTHDDRPLLPDLTSDERDAGWGEAPEPDDDERYLREIPPHHGS